MRKYTVTDAIGNLSMNLQSGISSHARVIQEILTQQAMIIEDLHQELKQNRKYQEKMFQDRILHERYLAARITQATRRAGILGAIGGAILSLGVNYLTSFF